MVLFAVEPATTLDKIRQVPPAFWMRAGVVVLGVIAVVVVLRYLMSLNKFIVAAVALIVAVLVGVNWIYTRSEPAFLTPYVDRLAPYFPSQGDYAQKQAAPAKE